MAHGDWRRKSCSTMLCAAKASMLHTLCTENAMHQNLAKVELMNTALW